MNLGLIPIIMTVAIGLLCGSAAGLGALLLIDDSARPLGRQVLRCSAISLFMGWFCAWAGLFFCSFTPLTLWAAGPAGVLFGVVWHCTGWPILSRGSRRSQEDAADENGQTGADDRLQ